jgi:hypothetical protein
MKGRVIKFLFKTALYMLPVLLFFEVLFRLGYAPIITNSTLFDMKMMRLQKQHIKSVKLLSIGSSVSLYELNSAIIVQNLPGPYYNFASWGLQISDMRVLLSSFVKDYRPQYIIIASSIGDFISPSNDSYLNYVKANSYIRNNFPEIFYFENYNSIHQVIRRKHTAYPVNFDKWGGALLTVKTKYINRDKWNGRNIFPTRYTLYQYRELDNLAAWLNTQHIKLIFAQAPIKASYSNTPASKQILKQHFSKCRSIIQDHGGVYLNYDNPHIFTDSLFFDQYHLQAAGGVILTKLIVKDLKPIVR